MKIIVSPLSQKCLVFIFSVIYMFEEVQEHGYDEVLMVLVKDY